METTLSQFELVNSGIFVQGEQLDISTRDLRLEFPTTSNVGTKFKFETGDYPNWTVGRDSSEPVEHGLVQPLARLAPLNPGSTTSYSLHFDLWLSNDQDVIDNMQWVCYRDTVNPNRLHIVACYGGDENPNKTNVPGYMIIPSDVLGEDQFQNVIELKEVVMYLFKEDPRTSRGTVTTVIYGW